MKDAEKIAREITDTWVRLAIGPVTARNLADVIATELRSAYSAGYAAAREQAAGVAESYEPRCDTCPSGVSTAIRTMEPQLPLDNSPEPV